MRWTIACRRCGHDIQVGDGWSFCGFVVECPACFTLNAAHVDEDSDCNFWFLGDEPYGDEQEKEPEE